jgi:hypothetical protein
MISLKIIPLKNKFMVIIDFIFKISIGLFIIIFFSTHKIDHLNNHDKIIIILSGFILILLIDYIQIIDILTNKNNDILTNKNNDMLTNKNNDMLTNNS